MKIVRTKALISVFMLLSMGCKGLAQTPYDSYVDLIERMRGVQDGQESEMYRDLTIEIHTLALAVLSDPPQRDFSAAKSAQDDAFRHLFYGAFSGDLDFLLLRKHRGDISDDSARELGIPRLRALLRAFPVCRTSPEAEDMALLTQLAHFLTLLEDQEVFIDLLKESFEDIPRDRRVVPLAVLSAFGISDTTSGTDSVDEESVRRFRNLFKSLHERVERNFEQGEIGVQLRTDDPFDAPDPFADDLNN